VSFLELIIRAEIHPFVFWLKVSRDDQLGCFLFSVNRLVCVVDANGVVVDVLFFLSVREVREVLNKVDRCVFFAQKGEAGLVDLWPACWRRGLEFRGLEVEMGDEEVVAVCYAGDDFVTVVWHDTECLSVC
jgi:hypothetical protein